MSLPPTFVAGALYDHVLQGALRHFFGRATFETEAVASLSSDGRLSIEPTKDPAALTVRWFGSRHTLRVPPLLPFTPHEVRFARAIGTVLAARYRAIFDTRLMAERGDLFRGSIEDRYVGAFLDPATYSIAKGESRADRIASAIEVLRVAALSSYENRPISSGVLLLAEDEDPCRLDRPAPPAESLYAQALTAVKSFYRLCDGLHTLFLVNQRGLLLDVVDISRWASRRCGDRPPAAPCADAYRDHARATLDSGHVSVVLSPSHEIKVFAEGAQVFAFRNAHWHLLDLQAKYERWVQAVGEPALAERFFQTALNLADAREGALFVVLRAPEVAAAQLIAPADRLDVEVAGAGDPAAWPSRRQLLGLLSNRMATEIDPSVLAAVATMDGATVVDRRGRLLAVGAILLHPVVPDEAHGVVEGARTTAALTASRFGPVLKVSEDGIITFFDGAKVWDV